MSSRKEASRNKLLSSGIVLRPGALKYTQNLAGICSVTSSVTLDSFLSRWKTLQSKYLDGCHMPGALVVVVATQQETDRQDGTKN